jgi:hypothetical protein
MQVQKLRKNQENRDFEVDRERPAQLKKPGAGYVADRKMDEQS